jgi:ketol-acid reductoisomerase
MVAPKAPGHRVREVFKRAAALRVCWPCTRTPPATARPTGAGYGRGIGCTRAGVIETTFLGGDRDRSVRRAGRALRRHVGAREGRLRDAVEAGYQPEVAYFECLHELKLIVDLMYAAA